jgi:hypothetical protein
MLKRLSLQHEEAAFNVSIQPLELDNHKIWLSAKTLQSSQ